MPSKGSTLVYQSIEIQEIMRQTILTILLILSALCLGAQEKTLRVDYIFPEQTRRLRFRLTGFTVSTVGQAEA